MRLLFELVARGDGLVAVSIKDGVLIIGVSPLHHPHRQRFSIAHEIAHRQPHHEYITSTVQVGKR
jgi:Zn-dependent peptidase ImmA (M78 family)